MREVVRILAIAARISLATLALAAASGCAGTHMRPRGHDGDTAALQPVLLGQRDLSVRLSDWGYPTDYDCYARRNSTGSRVYLYQWPHHNGTDKGSGVLVVEGGRVVKHLMAPVGGGDLGDDGQFVDWVDGHRLVFRSGARIDLALVKYVQGHPLYGRIGVDWAGRYFFNEVGEGVVDIGASANPARVLAVSKLNWPQTIFSGGDRIYLCGHYEARWNTVCEIYTIGRQGALLTDKKVIEGSNDVADIDCATERALVTGTSDFFRSVWVVDLKTGSWSRVGFDQPFKLFLQPGVIGASS